jgi:hypothetical protein
VEKLQSMGIDPAKPNAPEEFGRFLRDDVARWSKVVREAGIRLE